MISDSRLGLRPSGARRGRRSAVQSGMVDPGDEAHGVNERLPGIALARQHPVPLGGQAVEPAPPLSRFLDPPAVQPAALLQSIQERVERRDVELELPGGLGLDLLADLVSMTGARFDDREDDQLRRALLQFAVEHPLIDSCHSYICYSQSQARVNREGPERGLGVLAKDSAAALAELLGQRDDDALGA